MRIEPKAAFYNEETGAVQPWKDIEVTDSVGNALVSEGLAIAIAEGGGSGGDSDFNTATVSVTGASGSFYAYCNQDPDSQEYTNIFVLEDGNFNTYLYAPDLGETVTGTLLYKGDSYTLSPYNVVVSVTGDAEYDEENYVIVGTGDCAISGFIDD